MTALSMDSLRMGLASLAVFRGVLGDPVVAAFRRMAEGGEAHVSERLERLSAFAGLLLDRGDDWSAYLLEQVLCDENRYARLRAAGKPPALLKEQAARELAILEAASRLTAAEAAACLELPVETARWDTSPLDFAAAYEERMANLSRTGTGIFARHHMFRLLDGEPVPVKHPDPVLPQNLTGYDRERQAVLDNTLALLEGRPAANVLLYGDSGTGKSTCVKAVANALRDRGLRLVELGKDQLHQLPGLMDRLWDNPLKFILFIDDLSFTRESDSYAALKAMLEGSVSAKAPNMAIYATSNRRHLIREAMSDREGDDIHLRDTLEELTSLSDRFGLLVTFLRPEREIYLEIAARYCAAYGTTFDAAGAEAFALRHGGRSARAARQYAEERAAATAIRQRESRERKT